jgi:hypothetical protein
MGDRARLHPAIAPWTAAPDHTDRGPRASHLGVEGVNGGNVTQSLRLRSVCIRRTVALNVHHDNTISNLVGLFAWQAAMPANRVIHMFIAPRGKKGNIAVAQRMKSYGAQALPVNGGPGGSIQDRLSGRRPRRR